MKILTEYPPNFDKISEALPGARKEGIIFAYHPYVYKPHGKPELPPELVAHEQVHLNQQATYPGGVAQWWSDYISSGYFRLREEMLAHIAEARSMADQKGSVNRNERRKIAARVGGRLASPLYSAGTSKREATKLINDNLRTESVK